MSYIVLSRKYRPKDLDDLIGQEVLATSLRNSIDNKKVPHAFLFCGMRGVGKTTTARILARCLNCIGPDGNTDTTSHPCGVCRSCIAMDHDNHMDVMEFDAASRTGVDDIREIVDACQYMPVLGRYKIFIIDEVHMLSKSAFNALLKTLEEPPAHVKFIFATTEMNKIPETILSRCMTFKLKPVSLEALANHLVIISTKESFSLAKEVAELIAEESEGSVRDALSILEQAMMQASTSKTIDMDMIVGMLGGARKSDITNLWSFILNGKTEESLVLAQELIQNGSDPVVLYKNLQSNLYKMISEKVLGKINSEHSLSNLLYIWQILLKQAENFRSSSYPEHVLNAMIIILSHTASFPDIEKLMIGNTEESKENPISMTEKQTGLVNKVENIIGKKIEVKEDPSNKVIQDVLSKFSGATVTEIE